MGSREEEKVVSRKTQKERKTDMDSNANLTKMYKTQWQAYFKRGLGKPVIVYGEDERTAKANALAYYRKNKTLVDYTPMEKIVDHVDLIG